MPIVRPKVGGEIALSDDDLAQIGLAIVFESGAKAVVASALRALCSLSEKEWIRLERVQFSQILDRIEITVKELNDQELSLRYDDLRLSIEQSHELRHIIVHVMWGIGGTGFVGYDYSRGREVNADDIEQAVNGCAEIKRAASWFAMRVANLVEDGVLPERSSGRGMTIRTLKGPVRL